MERNFKFIETPEYYQKGNYSCLEMIKRTQSPEMYSGFLDGNVKKYIWRWRDKGKVSDLRKAEYYLRLLIKEQSGA